MNVSDKASTLRAQDHSHPPVVCFEPEIAKREGASRFVKDKSVIQLAAFMGGQGAKARSIAYCDDGSTPTLKSAPSGSNTVPDVVSALEGNTIDRGSKSDTLTANDYKDPVIVCYVATGFAEYKETLPTLRASSGDLGGGSEGLIVTRKANDLVGGARR